MLFRNIGKQRISHNVLIDCGCGNTYQERKSLFLFPTTYGHLGIQIPPTED